MGQSRPIVCHRDCLMVSFICSHCGRKLQVGEALVGPKVECLCGQLVSVTSGEETTELPAVGEPGRVTSSGLETRGNAEAKPPSDKELYAFLAPPQARDELGRLGSYRVLKVLGAGGMGVVFQAEDV